MITISVLDAIFEPAGASDAQKAINKRINKKHTDAHAQCETTLEENLAMIRETIEYLRSQGRKVVYDAEHWFDGYKHNPEYALETLRAAIAAGGPVMERIFKKRKHELKVRLREKAG